MRPRPGGGAGQYTVRFSALTCPCSEALLGGSAFLASTLERWVIGVHTLGDDVPLFAAVLKPSRAALGTEGTRPRTHNQDHAIGRAYRALQQSHASCPFPPVQLVRAPGTPVGSGLSLGESWSGEVSPCECRRPVGRSLQPVGPSSA
jgi:hypothetical protein